MRLVQIAEILYGEPAYSDDFADALKSGNIVLEGCCITEDDPKWQCVDCKREI